MSFSKLTIRDIPVENKTILVRADYNVPLDGDGVIRDDMRIRSSIPTLQYLLDNNCRVVVISHLGRPEGVDPSLSLEPIARRLAAVLSHEVRFCDQTVGDKAYQSIKHAPRGSVTVLENLRFNPGEEANSDAFARQIADTVRADYFVQDGFGVVHRAHASTDAITGRIPSVAGLLLEYEYTTITDAMEHPQRPLVAVMGGAKVSDKIGVIEHFVEIADRILVGGAMANTFLAHKGNAMGESLVETGQFETLDRLYAAVARKVGAENVDDFIVLPVDVATTTEPTPDATRVIRRSNDVQPTDIALDIGDESIQRLVDAVADAKTVIWNGTLGYAELAPFSHGSARLALALASQPETTSIIGGGDTADFVRHWDSAGGKSFTLVSTGGGASLELMAGLPMPGIHALLDARR